MMVEEELLEIVCSSTARNWGGDALAYLMIVCCKKAILSCSIKCTLFGLQSRALQR